MHDMHISFYNIERTARELSRVPLCAEELFSALGVLIELFLPVCDRRWMPLSTRHRE